MGFPFSWCEGSGNESFLVLLYFGGNIWGYGHRPRERNDEMTEKDVKMWNKQNKQNKDQQQRQQQRRQLPKPQQNRTYRYQTGEKPSDRLMKGVNVYTTSGKDNVRKL